MMPVSGDLYYSEVLGAYAMSNHAPVAKSQPVNQTSRLFALFRKDSSGATIVEFSLIALPFFILIFAIMQVALVFFANVTLDNGVAQAGRMIRTGQAQSQGFDETQFKQKVCESVSALPDCENKLMLDVKSFASFQNVNLEDAIDGNGNINNGNFEFNMGGAGDVIVVRAFYEWDLIGSLPVVGLGNLANGNRLLDGIAAFRNEPF